MTALYSSSITVDQVIDAVTAFIYPFFPNGEIVRAQVNRVALPSNPCIVLTEMTQVDLSVPFSDYQPDDDTAEINGPSRIDIQADIYGSNAGQICKTIKTAFRSHWGFANFPANVKPLYTSDGTQAPLLTGEQQYESRWTLTLSIQYNPTITVPQEFADTLEVTEIIPVVV